MFKPAFTQPAQNTSFGFPSASTSAPFGQSNFGKMTNTSGFGSNTFGASSTPMFGNQNQPQTGLFTSTASVQPFGQPAQPQSGFAFGASNTTSNLFNQSQQPSSSGLFGSTANSTFGQKAPFSTFGSTTSTGIFGSAQSTQPQTQATPLFGQAATQNSGLFGGTSAFSSNQANQQTGTVIKFNPVTGTDTMMKNRQTHQIQTRHHCITFMKEYETKSLEELRYEDYLVNRKGPQQGSSGANLFEQMSTTNIGGGPGLFGTTPSSQGFGQTSSVFGQPQNTNLFGQKPAFGGPTVVSTATPFSFNPQPTSTVTPFGNTQAKPFGAPAQNTSLFSTPSTQSTNTFGATNSFGGFGATTSQSSFGLNQNKPSTGTFTLNPTNTTGFNTFGQQQSTLFGGNKTTPNVFGQTSGGFGQQTMSQPTFGGFGATQPQTNLLFNNQNFGKPATTGGFGTVQPQSTVFMGMGTLNQPQQQTSNNLFGQKTTNSIFGQQTAPQQTMSFNGFGQQNPSSTGMLSFGSSLLGQNQQQSSFFPTLNSSSNIHDQILTIAKPYPSIECLKGISPAKNAIPNTSPINIQSLNDENSSLKCSWKQQQIPCKLRSLPSSNNELKTLFDGLEPTDGLVDENIFTTKPRNPRRLYITKVDLVNAVDTVDTVDSDVKDAPSESAIETVNESTNEISDITWMDNLDCRNGEIRPTNLDHAEIEIRQRHSVPTQTPSKFGSPEQSMLTSTKIVPEKSSKIFTLSRDDLNTSSASIENETVNSSNPTGIICTRSGYYTIPSLDELAKMMTPDGKCIVQGFTIGRRSYGNVFFPDTFDVAGINIDEHVHFRTKELVIYVNDENKPPLGHELNRHAQITLDQVYPREKKTMEAITDVDRLVEMNFEDILRESCELHGTTFVDYRPETGSWVFEVEHFTRYGLNDEEDVVVLKENSNSLRQERSTIEKPLENVFSKSNILKPIFPPSKGVIYEDEVESMDDKDSSIEEIASDDDIMKMVNEPMDDDESSENLHQFQGRSAYISPRMQSMKQTFFNDDNRSENSSQASGRILTTSSYVDFLTEEQIYVNELFTKAYQDSNIELESAEQLQEVMEQSVQTYKTPSIFKQSESIDPFQITSYSKFVYDSVDTSPECVSNAEKHILNNLPGIGDVDKQKYEELFGDTKRITDMSISRGINFRTSLGKADHFFIFNKFNNGFHYEGGSNGFQLLHLTFNNESYPDIDLFKTHIQEHLNIQLAHGDIEADEGFPYIFPLQGPKALHQHSEIAQKHYRKIDPRDDKNFIVGYTAHLWKLFEALWGEVLELESEAPDDHLTTSVRRSCVSTWLESYMEENLRLKERRNPQNLTLYDYICAHKLLEASHFALIENNLSLALLIVEMSSNNCLRAFIQEQLQSWQLVKINKYITKDIQKIYSLLGGIAVTKNDTWGIINVCEDLNWLQSYALHLWYLTPLELTITDITNEYRNAFKEDNYAASPEPLYTQHKSIHSNVPIYDLYYHLLRLYSNSAYPMEKLLNPVNYTADPMDYSLSWFTLENLKALGYVHLREDAEDKIHERFASQLERCGLWEWAIFVLLHIKNVIERRQMVVNVINRNVSINKNDIDYIEKERFVVRELYVPSKYFSHAKGFKAMFDGKHNAALSHFIAAGDGYMVREVFWNHVGPKELTNKNYKYLRRITQYMIMGGYNGDIHLIIYYFIQEIDRIMQKIKTGNVTYIRDYLDRITQQLPTICNKIIVTQTRTAEQFLMVAEICKNIINLVKIVIENIRGNDISPLSTVALLASKLPLPPDYIIKEIQDIIYLYVEKHVKDSTYEVGRLKFGVA